MLRVSVDGGATWIDAPEGVRMEEVQEHQWSQWHDNPFKAMKEIATSEDFEKVVDTFRGAVSWEEWNYRDFVDELLQEIAGDTNIVCQYEELTGKFRAVYDK